MKLSFPVSFSALLSSAVTLFVVLLLSGCMSSGSNFDESKISNIKKGETSEQDLVSWFGPALSRSVNGDGVVTLHWAFMETNLKGQSFIPIVGPLIGGTEGKRKGLSVMLAENKVTNFTYSGSGSDAHSPSQAAAAN